MSASSLLWGVPQTPRRPRPREDSVVEPTVLAAGVDQLAAVCRPGAPGRSPGPVQVLDLGGGTGGQALRLVQAGHDVTVVDPSLDALAALGRRAAEAGVADRLRGVQGDAEDLGDVLGESTVDLVLCHGVLEVVDDPQVALGSIRRVLREPGRLSLLVAQRHAAVLSRVSSGQLHQAHHIAHDPDGRWGGGDLLRRRFDLDQVMDLLRSTGFGVVGVEGIRVFSDLLPRSTGPAGGDPDRALLADLEAWAGTQPGFVGVAAQLHVHAAPA